MAYTLGNGTGVEGLEKGEIIVRSRRRRSPIETGLAFFANNFAGFFFRDLHLIFALPIVGKQKEGGGGKHGKYLLFAMRGGRKKVVRALFSTIRKRMGRKKENGN